MGGDTVVGSNVVRQQWLIDRWMRCLPGMCKTSLMFFFFFGPSSLYVELLPPGAGHKPHAHTPRGAYKV